MSATTLAEPISNSYLPLRGEFLGHIFSARACLGISYFCQTALYFGPGAEQAASCANVLLP